MPSASQIANALITSLLTGSEREAARNIIEGIGVAGRIGRSAFQSTRSPRTIQPRQRKSRTEDIPDISDLKSLFDTAGMDIQNFAPSGPGVGTIEKSPLEPLGRGGRRGGSRGGFGGRGGGSGIGEPPPLGPAGQPFPEPSRERDTDYPPWMDNDVHTPNSTNVYSFAFRPDSSKRRGSLFVTFRGHSVNSGNTRSSRGASGKRQGKQLSGKLGGTVGGKTDMPGAVYEYLDVPTEVANKLFAVKDMGDQEGPGVKSPGTFVWSELRERGTIHGHKYRYRLVQGALITQPGVHGIYVPRKATAKGFRVRSEADMSGALNRGRRGFVRSTLPSVSFSTRGR